MMMLPCPHCGPRDAAEFVYIDEHRSRPDPNRTTPQEWRHYLYVRSNPAGWTQELWFHRAGCGTHLLLERHTVTGDVRAHGPAGGER